MEIDILQDLKNYFGDDYDEEQEPTLLFCIKRAILSFKNKRNYPKAYSEQYIEDDMKRFYTCIFDLTLYWINMQGYEFQSSHSENGVNQAWNSESDIYALHNVIPVTRII